jgi:hypothetical protein
VLLLWLLGWRGGLLEQLEESPHLLSYMPSRARINQPRPALPTSCCRCASTAAA